MILPPFSAPTDFVIAFKAEGQSDADWFIFMGDKLLVSLDGSLLPDNSVFDELKSFYMGKRGDRHIYAGEVIEQDPPQGWMWKGLRSLHLTLPQEHFSLAGRALQLVDWTRTNQFCGRCGEKTERRDYELCLECPSCKHLSYPKMAPAIMALVKKDDKILLARGPQFPDKMFSVLAGYVDPGETLEQCVVREVFEEVGLKVKNLRYWGSQPWPLSRSLMIAFVCDWAEGEIKIDQIEIVSAGWYDKESLPELPPLISIARLLIDAHL